MILSIFPCSYWPFVCLLWGNVYTHSLMINWISFFVCFVFAIELYVFFIYFGYYLLIWYMVDTYFLPVSRFPVHYVGFFFFPLLYRSFVVCYSHSRLLLFRWLVLLVCGKKVTKTKSKCFFLMYSFRSFIGLYLTLKSVINSS